MEIAIFIKKHFSKIAIILLILLAIAQCGIVKSLREKAAKEKNNVEILMSSPQKYTVNDSLNAMKVKALELSLKEYKAYRKEDAAIIKKLKADKAINSNAVQTLTRTKVVTKTRDSTIIRHVRDTVYREQVAYIDYNSKWTTVKGYVDKDSAYLDISNKEELILSESVTRKKFLFIKLPVWLFGYRSRVVNVVSKNPNTQIINVESVKFR